MTTLDEIEFLGVAPRWPSRKAVIGWIEKTTPWPIEQAIKYNSGSDRENTRNGLPDLAYGGVGWRLINKAEGIALKGGSWETKMICGLGYFLLSNTLNFFSHRQFRINFPNSPQPMRLMGWQGMVEAMALQFILGRIEEGIYQGYLAYATLKQSYQVKQAYEAQHRRAHAFMHRLFGAWRGGVSHAWPPYAYDEPIYEGILERWNEPDAKALTPWLIAACDRHTHQAQRETEKIFYDFSSRARMPIEILLLFRLRELVGLQNPVLDHPLMEVPFDRLPDPQSAYEPDELVRGTLARVRQDWPEFDEVVSLKNVMEMAR